MGDQVLDTHRQGERNRARTAEARARVHPVVPAPPSAGRSALESLQQGHTERPAGTLFTGRWSTIGRFLLKKTERTLKKMCSVVFVPLEVHVLPSCTRACGEDLNEELCRAVSSSLTWRMPIMPGFWPLVQKAPLLYLARRGGVHEN